MRPSSGGSRRISKRFLPASALPAISMATPASGTAAGAVGAAGVADWRRACVSGRRRRCQRGLLRGVGLAFGAAALASCAAGGGPPLRRDGRWLSSRRGYGRCTACRYRRWRLAACRRRCPRRRVDVLRAFAGSSRLPGAGLRRGESAGLSFAACGSGRHSGQLTGFADIAAEPRTLFRLGCRARQRRRYRSRRADCRCNRRARARPRRWGSSPESVSLAAMAAGSAGVQAVGRLAVARRFGVIACDGRLGRLAVASALPAPATLPAAGVCGDCRRVVGRGGIASPSGLPHCRRLAPRLAVGRRLARIARYAVMRGLRRRTPSGGCGGWSPAGRACIVEQACERRAGARSEPAPRGAGFGSDGLWPWLVASDATGGTAGLRISDHSICNRQASPRGTIKRLI